MRQLFFEPWPLDEYVRLLHCIEEESDWMIDWLIDLSIDLYCSL